MQPEAGAGEILANLSIGYIIAAAFVLTAIRVLLVPNKSTAARSITELIESLLIAGVLVFLIIRPFFLQAFYIPSESMEPTLMGHEAGYNLGTDTENRETIHDRIFVNKLVYHFGDPKREDIVVFRAPKQADIQDIRDNKPAVENVLIKRVIGIPGDVIEVKPDNQGTMRVWRNGKPVDEPVCNKKASNEPCINEPLANPQNQDAQYAVNGPYTLKPGEYFMMGDNRNHSNDSRFWGPLDRNRVIGKAMFIFWPLNRIRILK